MCVALPTESLLLDPPPLAPQPGDPLLPLARLRVFFHVLLVVVIVLVITMMMVMMIGSGGFGDEDGAEAPEAGEAFASVEGVCGLQLRGCADDGGDGGEVVEEECVEALRVGAVGAGLLVGGLGGRNRPCHLAFGWEKMWLVIDRRGQVEVECSLLDEQWSWSQLQVVEVAIRGILCMRRTFAL